MSSHLITPYIIFTVNTLPNLHNGSPSCFVFHRLPIALNFPSTAIILGFSEPYMIHPPLQSICAILSLPPCLLPGVSGRSCLPPTPPPGARLCSLRNQQRSPPLLLDWAKTQRSGRCKKFSTQRRQRRLFCMELTRWGESGQAGRDRYRISQFVTLARHHRLQEI